MIMVAPGAGCQIHEEHEVELSVPFMAGHAGTALDGQFTPGVEVIGKPFALDALAAKIRATPETASAG